MNNRVSFDPVWEQKYEQGHEQRYPWDTVVSFVFRNSPRDKPRNEVSILEVGCGTAANLWFAAVEGFRVAGVDGSIHAITKARRRFADEKLEGEFRVEDFTSLSFDDDSFDLVIDRAALTCCGATGLTSAVNEIHRVLHPGGKFFFNPYASNHSCAKFGRIGPDGVVLDITEGSLAGAGQIHFVRREEIDELFGVGWSLLSVKGLEITDHLGDSDHRHAEWRVIAQKTG